MKGKTVYNSLFTHLLRSSNVEIVEITSGPKHHFFGYFDKCPWNASGKHILSHEVDFCDRPLTEDDKATIGIVDLTSGNKFQPLTETYGWSWQQGAMLQWHPAFPEDKIIFNDRRDGQFVSVIRDINSGEEKVLPLPVAAVSPDGRLAVSLNFSRLAEERPGYGYEGIPDRFRDEDASDKDGIYSLDMETGQNKLIISLAQIVGIGHNPTMDGVKHWFNHLFFSPDSKRFIFLHRWRCHDEDFQYAHYTRMFTANADGSDIYCVNDHEMTSHFDWRDNNHIIAWAHRRDIGNRYFLFEDKSDNVIVIGDEKLTALDDGHCNYSPDRKWILTDTYPGENDTRKLLIYNPRTDVRIDLGDFHSEPWLAQSRCDLHPRWSRDGKWICIDSSHTGKRQIYILNREE